MRWPSSCCAWLMRHGQSEGNAAGLVQGQTAGGGLSPTGRRQVLAAADALPGRGLAPATVISSDLPRCRQTAAVLGQALGLEVTLEPRLRERSFGAMEGRRWAEVSPAAVGIVDGRVVDPAARPPGGESVADLQDRVRLALGAAADRAGPLLVVTHGGPIRVARAGGLQDLIWVDVPHATPIPICLRRCAAPDAAVRITRQMTLRDRTLRG